TGISGRALANRCNCRRRTRRHGLRAKPDAGAMAYTAGRPITQDMVADPAGYAGTHWRLHDMGAAECDGAVSMLGRSKWLSAQLALKLLEQSLDRSQVLHRIVQLQQFHLLPG